MKFAAVFLIFGVMSCWGQRPFSRSVHEYSKSLAPYVVSPQQIVDLMLDAAAVKPGEVVYDLGCGDARILITAVQRFQAQGVGVELSEELVRSANAKVQSLNLQDRIKIIHGDLMTVNLSPANVVVIYLETGSNDKLRPNLEKSLRPGARVVSHDFAVRGWRPQRVEKVHAYRRHHTVYVYEMPPEKQ